jgi:hypothetical protein
MIPNYTEKWEYLVNKHGVFCPIQRHYLPKSQTALKARVTDLHHMCHNTKWRRKNYPLFIHSLLNLLPVNNAWHLKHGAFKKIDDLQAAKYEKFLSNHPKISEFVNNPIRYYVLG